MLPGVSGDRVRADLGAGGRKPETPRFPFLDGLRGLTALYVLLHHAAAELDYEPVRGLAWELARVLRFGHYAVAVFIVLSGFCLALPVVNDPERRLRGGFRGYLARRARRILPPYYATLFLLLAIMAIVPALRYAVTLRWAFAVPTFEPGVILSHLFLFHNFSPLWAGRIDPPMWSIAVEWQIYLAFPLLLVVWRRWGLAAMVATTLVIGNLDKGFSVVLRREVFNSTCPWYLVLFALGAAAATLGVKRGRSLPWFAAAAFLYTLSSRLIVTHPERLRWNDHLFGLATATLLVACARASAESGRLHAGVRALLESRFAMGVGTVSYSLYLIHFPLLSWTHAALMPLGWTASTRLLVLVGVVSPACVGVSYLFYRVFERPTLVRPRAAEGRAPAPSPASSALAIS